MWRRRCRESRRLSISESISRYSRLPAGAVKEWVPGELDEIGSGILFVLATWSGQASGALACLTSKLAELDDPPVVWVCDNDRVPPILKQHLGELHGYGETFWIQAGEVVGSLTNYAQEDWSEQVARNNQALDVMAGGTP